jgi:Ca2+/Na+ antiporter
MEMQQALGNVLSSAYTQVLLFFLLVAYFFSHRKDPRLVVSGISMVRTVVLLLIFLYFLWNWSSEIPPSLRSASVFGMFLINLYMLFNLTLTRLERPYRNALENLGQDPRPSEHLPRVWRSGKRFFYAQYFLSSLFVRSPFSFLHALAGHRVRADIQEVLARAGLEKRLVTLKTMAAYLENQVAGDENLPQDFKDLMHQTIQQFAGHPWVEDQVNRFLEIATETPEELHYPKWRENWEKSVKS